MVTKTLSIALLCWGSINATIYTCINQSGFDIGIGNNVIDAVIKGNFCYLSMDYNYKAYRVSVGPNLEYRLINTPSFKMYVMSGAFIEYGNYYSAYLASLGNQTRQETLYGFTVLALRPEAIISPKVSLYSNVTCIKYETGSEVGSRIWMFNFFSSSALENRDGIPEIGIKIYF
jgi:hypothetical protein